MTCMKIVGIKFHLYFPLVNHSPPHYQTHTVWATGKPINKPWNSPGRNTGVGGRSLLQGIFSTPGSSPGLLNCRWILYCLNQTGMNLFPLFLLQVTNDLQLTPFMRKVKSSMSIHFFKCEKSRKALLESYSDRNDKWTVLQQTKDLNDW